MPLDRQLMRWQQVTAGNSAAGAGYASNAARLFSAALNNLKSIGNSAANAKGLELKAGKKSSGGKDKGSGSGSVVLPSLPQPGTTGGAAAASEPENPYLNTSKFEEKKYEAPAKQMEGQDYVLNPANVRRIEELQTQINPSDVAKQIAQSGAQQQVDTAPIEMRQAMDLNNRQSVQELANPQMLYGGGNAPQAAEPQQAEPVVEDMVSRAMQYKAANEAMDPSEAAKSIAPVSQEAPVDYQNKVYADQYDQAAQFQNAMNAQPAVVPGQEFAQPENAAVAADNAQEMARLIARSQRAQEGQILDPTMDNALMMRDPQVVNQGEIDATNALNNALGNLQMSDDQFNALQAKYPGLKRTSDSGAATRKQFKKDSGVMKYISKKTNGAIPSTYEAYKAVVQSPAWSEYNDILRKKAQITIELQRRYGKKRPPKSVLDAYTGDLNIRQKILETQLKEEMKRYRKPTEEQKMQREIAKEIAKRTVIGKYDKQQRKQNALSVLRGAGISNPTQDQVSYYVNTGKVPKLPKSAKSKKPASFGKFTLDKKYDLSKLDSTDKKDATYIMREAYKRLQKRGTRVAPDDVAVALNAHLGRMIPVGDMEFSGNYFGSLDDSQKKDLIDKVVKSLTSGGQ